MHAHTPALHTPAAAVSAPGGGAAAAVKKGRGGRWGAGGLQRAPTEDR